MADIQGEQWVMLTIFSFIVTWIIGLAPPLLIRFVFMRRPIQKGWAIFIVAIFWLFNSMLSSMLNIAAGGSGRVPGVWAVIAIVSYLILRKTTKKHLHSLKLQNTITKPQPMVDPLDTTFQTVSTSVQHPCNVDERIYAVIAEEIDSGTIDKGLWTRLLTECDGDQRRTKVLYIKHRHEHLSRSKRLGVERSDTPPNASNDAPSSKQTSSIGGVKIVNCMNCGSTNVVLRSEIAQNRPLECHNCKKPLRINEKDNRIPCGDNCCTGSIHDNGRCGYCGKTFEEGQKENLG